MDMFDDASRRAAQHRPSHATLLRPLSRALRSDGTVDAVIVPTHRPVVYLTAAVELAGALGCPILVLCSGDSKARSAAELLTEMSGLAVTVASTPGGPLLELHTQRLARPLSAPYLDTGNKRNVALILARMLNWERILFLDDDIREIPVAGVRAAAAAVQPGGLRIVGWRLRDFPDNSVVGHALRSSGRPQDVFIGSGALLVGLFDQVPFFPPIYNEDWLFWHDQLARQEVGLAGEVHQLGYDPFDPARARREEFGDVLGEGLFGLLEVGSPLARAYFPAYWEFVLTERRLLLSGILSRLTDLAGSTRDAHRYERELLAVEAGRDQLAGITARSLAEFVGAWRFDLYRWNARMHHLPTFTGIPEALAWLGITDVHGA